MSIGNGHMYVLDLTADQANQLLPKVIFQSRSLLALREGILYGRKRTYNTRALVALDPLTERRYRELKETLAEATAA